MNTAVGAAEAAMAEAHAQREIAETDAARWRLHAEQTRCVHIFSYMVAS